MTAFRLGQVVSTPGALEALGAAGKTPLEFIARHASGDWGDVCREDWELNDAAVANEGDTNRMGRTLSA